MTNLEERVSAIETRNKRVEADKAWETSFARRLTIAILTYVVMVLVMSSIGVEDIFVSAIIPTLGFVLSTFSLPYIKNIWLEKMHKK